MKNLTDKRKIIIIFFSKSILLYLLKFGLNMQVTPIQKEENNECMNK